MIRACLESRRSVDYSYTSFFSSKESKQGVFGEQMLLREKNSTELWGLRVNTVCSLNHMELLMFGCFCLGSI